MQTGHTWRYSPLLHTEQLASSGPGNCISYDLSYNYCCSLSISLSVLFPLALSWGLHGQTQDVGKLLSLGML